MAAPLANGVASAVAGRWLRNERCVVAVSPLFLLLHVCFGVILPKALNNDAHDTYAGNLAFKYKVRSPVLRDSHIRTDTHAPKCYAPISSASNEHTLSNWLSLTRERKVNPRCHVVFVTQSALSIFKDQFFALISKPEMFLGSEKRLRRLGKNFEDFVDKKLSIANEVPGHNATKLLSLVHKGSHCQTSNFAIETFSEWNATVRTFVEFQMDIKNPQKLDVTMKSARQFAKVPTALSQLRSSFETHYTPSVKLCRKLAQLSWTLQFYPAFRVDRCIENMIMRTWQHAV